MEILKKVNLYIMLILPLLVASFLIPLFIKSGKLNYYPSKMIREVIPYHDGMPKEDGRGNSTIDHFHEDSTGAHISFTVRNNIKYPYAGIYFVLNDSMETLDLSKYTDVEIVIDNCNTSNILIMLRTFADSFSTWKNRHSFRYSNHEIEVNGKRDTLNLPLSSFVTPLWWLEEHKLKKSDLGLENFKKFVDIKFESSELILLDKQQTFSIESIVFSRSVNTQIYATIAGAIFIYLLIGLFYLYFKREEPKLIITYNKIDLSSHLDEETLKVVEYIAENYQNSSLTIGLISESIGISTARIAAVIKEAYKTSFRQYLNSIRLEEAKRLLLETDRQINEIYWRVGYSNKTHFYRVFKEYLKMSPQEFRKSEGEVQ